MPKTIDLSLRDKDHFLSYTKALGSEVRVNILELLNQGNLNVNEIAQRLSIPASTAALNIKVLEDAGLILTELQPGERGAMMKVCSRRYDVVSLALASGEPSIDAVHSIYLNMPIGHYSDCRIVPTCGILNERGAIDVDDDPRSFYHPSRTTAQLIWFYKGYVEYRFSNAVLRNATPQLLEVSLELCSEAPFYRNDWPSDITVWVNGIEIDTYTSPGDFGGRRGKFTPSWWSDVSTQYGLLKSWRIDGTGSFLDSQRRSNVTLKDVELDAKDFISVRIGIKDDARNVGGINIFGEMFGDFQQNIVMRLDYRLN
jgi:predicted transcriptional regulator